MLNLSSAHSLVDLLAADETQESTDTLRKFVTKHVSGLDFLPGVSHIRQMGHITPDNVRPFLKKAAQMYDFIVVDAGNMFSETLIHRPSSPMEHPPMPQRA